MDYNNIILNQTNIINQQQQEITNMRNHLNNIQQQIKI